jgi:integrase
MGLMLKVDKGVLRPWWYGDYKTREGRRTVANLGIRIEGKPPKSGRLSDRGDWTFEQSRRRAENALFEIQREARSEKMSRRAAFRQYQDRTGERLAAMPATSLRDVFTGDKRWTAMQRQRTVKFAGWLDEKRIASVLDVRVQHAREYLDKLGAVDGLTAATARKVKSTLAVAFDRTLPEEAANPFRNPMLKIHAANGDVEHHRKPLTPVEVEKLLETAARIDPEAHDWMVCSLSTSLRRGDVCRLRWVDVDMAKGALRVKTSKTGVALTFPILPRLAEVLKRRYGNSQISEKSPFVFPEAEKLIRKFSSVLTTRVKKVFAAALGPEDGEEASNPVAEQHGATRGVVDALAGLKMGAAKRERMERVLKLCGEGKSYSEIMVATGLSRGCVSGLVRKAEEASGIRFARRRGDGVAMREKIVNVTRVKREVGTMSASKYDFHCLRTTFVTLAISRGVSIDILRSLTGHTTVELVMRHYFKPKGSDFAEQLTKAMPGVLTRPHG